MKEDVCRVENQRLRGNLIKQEPDSIGKGDVQSKVRAGPKR